MDLGALQVVVRRVGAGGYPREFDGLIKAATQFALEALNVREERRAEDAARRSCKKPTLVVDNTGAVKKAPAKSKKV